MQCLDAHCGSHRNGADPLEKYQEPPFQVGLKVKVSQTGKMLWECGEIRTQEGRRGRGEWKACAPLRHARDAIRGMHTAAVRLSGRHAGLQGSRDGQRKALLSSLSPRAAELSRINELRAGQTGQGGGLCLMITLQGSR